MSSPPIEGPQAFPPPLGDGRVGVFECIDYMAGWGHSSRPSARFHRLPQLSHGLALIHQGVRHEPFPG